METPNAPFACVLNAWHDHEAELRGFLLRRVSDRFLADDLLQNIFVKAIQQGGHFCQLDNPRAWLFEVARNAIIDHQRLTKPNVPLPDDLAHDEPMAAPVDRLAQCLARVLSEMPESDRDILQRCDLDGMTQQAFADANALGLPAVKSRLQRARQRMRERLVQNCQIRFDDAGKVCCHVPREPLESGP